MGTIISNGKNIYRYNGYILRTPLTKTITIAPYEQAYYDIGDRYRQQIPTSDFFVTNRGVYAIASGHDMRKAYLLRQIPSGGIQLFRRNNLFPNYDSGYVFYNGNYSPANGLVGGSSFMRIPAYKFILPTKYRDWHITNVVLQTSDIGTTLFSGSPKEKVTDSRRYPVFAWDANTQILNSTSDWRDKHREINIGVFSTSQIQNSHPCNLYSQCQMSVTLNLQNTDACSNVGNYFQMWENWPDGSIKYSDGAIPTCVNNPHIQTHSVNSSFIASCDSLRNEGFFIPIIPLVGDSGGNDSTVTGNDYPYYYMSTGSTSYYKNWWLCERIMLQNIKVTIQLGE